MKCDRPKRFHQFLGLRQSLRRWPVWCRGSWRKVTFICLLLLTLLSVTIRPANTSASTEGPTHTAAEFVPMDVGVQQLLAVDAPNSDWVQGQRLYEVGQLSAA